MDIKGAFSAMKSGKTVKFWYCGQDEKGKPRMVCDATQPPQGEIDKILKTAKDKKLVATGVMRMTEDGLTVGVKGAPPTGFAKGVQIIAREANAMPKVILTTSQALLAEKALPERYQDENKKAGWRADGMAPKPGESDAEFAKRQKEFRESDKVTTKYYNEAEKKNAEVGFDKGKMTNAQGRAIKDKTSGFVIDPKTGKTYGFDGTKMDTTPDGKKQLHHHSSPLAGGKVAGAGQITTDMQGNVTEISDQSGHYKPGEELTHQAVKHFDEQGALETPIGDGKREAKVNLLDKNAAITDEQWQNVKGDSAAINTQVKLNQLKGPLGEQAFAELQQKRPEELKKLIASGKYKSIADLKAALGANALKKLEAEVKADPSKLEAKAKELYAKTPGVTVGNFSHNQTVVNLNAGADNAIVKKKSQYLQSEGNEAQMRNKDRLNTELQEKTAVKRGQLDAMAEARAKKGGQAKPGNGGAPNQAQPGARNPGSYVENPQEILGKKKSEPNYVDVLKDGPGKSRIAPTYDTVPKQDGAEPNYVEYTGDGPKKGEDTNYERYVVQKEQS